MTIQGNYKLYTHREGKLEVLSPCGIVRWSDSDAAGAGPESGQAVAFAPLAGDRAVPRVQHDCHHAGGVLVRHVRRDLILLALLLHLLVCAPVTCLNRPFEESHLPPYTLEPGP